MERKEIEQVIRRLAGHNQDFGLVLRMASRLERRSLGDLSDREINRASDIILGKVNSALGLNLKRNDVLGVGLAPEDGEAMADLAKLIRENVQVG